jgi:hypothetical protein
MVPLASTSPHKYFSLGGVERLSLSSRKPFAKKKNKDNPLPNRFIVVGTKAQRRETDVWGDAAGTAPAVTSVTSLPPSIFLEHYQRRAILARLLFASRVLRAGGL